MHLNITNPGFVLEISYCNIYYAIDPTIWGHLKKRLECAEDTSELCDVYSGKEYRKHKDFLSKPEHISLLLNTDGVCVFHSSTVSLWPLWLVINELPPSVR